MAHPDYIRQKAIDLREEKQLTIDEIAECLALPKATIYYWVGDIEIPRKPGVGFASEAQKKGTRAMQDKWKLIREEAYQLGVNQFAELSQDRTFRDFVCMYIGEGYKRSRNEVSLCNSDASVVRLADTWMRRLSRNPVSHSIQYHADQSLDELRAFWSEYLGIDGEAIRFQRKSNSNQLTGRKWRSQYGVLKVQAGDTRFRAQLEAWMDLVKADWG